METRTIEINYLILDDQIKIWLKWLLHKNEIINGNTSQLEAILAPDIKKQFFELTEKYSKFITNMGNEQKQPFEAYLNDNSDLIKYAVSMSISGIFITNTERFTIEKDPFIINHALVYQYAKLVELHLRYNLLRLSLYNLCNLTDETPAFDIQANARTISKISNDFKQKDPFTLLSETHDKINRVINPQSNNLFKELTDGSEIENINVNLYDVKKMNYKIDDVSQTPLNKQYAEAVKLGETDKRLMRQITRAFKLVESGGNNNYKQVTKKYNDNNDYHYKTLYSAFDAYVKDYLLIIDRTFTKPVSLIFPEKKSSEEGPEAFTNKNEISLSTLLDFTHVLNLSTENIASMQAYYFLLIIKFLIVADILVDITDLINKAGLNIVPLNYAEPAFILNLLKRAQDYLIKSKLENKHSIEYEKWCRKMEFREGELYIKFDEKIKSSGEKFSKEINERVNAAEKKYNEFIQSEAYKKDNERKEREARMIKLEEDEQKARACEKELYELLEIEKQRRREEYNKQSKNFNKTKKVKIADKSLEKTEQTIKSTTSSTIHSPIYEPVIYFKNRQLDSLFAALENKKITKEMIQQFRLSITAEIKPVEGGDPEDFDYLCHCYAKRAEAELLYIKDATSKEMTEKSVRFCFDQANTFMQKAIEFTAKWRDQQSTMISKKYTDKTTIAALNKQLNNEIQGFLKWCRFTINDGKDEFTKQKNIIINHKELLKFKKNELEYENANSEAIRDQTRNKNNKKRSKKRSISNSNNQTTHVNRFVVERENNRIQIEKLKQQIKECENEEKFMDKLNNEFSKFSNGFNMKFSAIEAKSVTEKNHIPLKNTG